MHDARMQTTRQETYGSPQKHLSNEHLCLVSHTLAFLYSTRANPPTERSASVGETKTRSNAPFANSTKARTIYRG